MKDLNTNQDLVTIAEFAQRIRLSKQRLYQLWNVGKAGFLTDTRRTAQARYLYLDQGCRSTVA